MILQRFIISDNILKILLWGKIMTFVEILEEIIKDYICKFKIKDFNSVFKDDYIVGLKFLSTNNLYINFGFYKVPIFPIVSISPKHYSDNSYTFIWSGDMEDFIMLTGLDNGYDFNGYFLDMWLNRGEEEQILKSIIEFCIDKKSFIKERYRLE
jgi:hypothetical protein